MKNSTSKFEESDSRPRAIHDYYHDHHHHHHHHGASSNNGGLINVNVSHGTSQLQISVPSHSTFGDMKEAIAQKTGLEPRRQQILFRGKEKEDGEFLHEAGVKDNSKVLVLEKPVMEEKKVEETKEREETSSEVVNSAEMLKALQAIANVRDEVDKLAERVSALQVAVKNGTKVADEEFVVSSELLMRQLLKLDTIEAGGEAKLQRKAEVRRIQNFHEVLDNLKSMNSKPFANKSNDVSVTTEWETFDSGLESSSPPPPVSSSTRITQDWERFD